MPVTSIGDMSQHFQSLRQTGAIKDRMLTLAQELSTGTKADLTTHMGGDTGRLSVLDRELSTLSAFELTNADLARNLAKSQTILESADGLRNQMAARFVQITPSTTTVEIREAGARARTDFATLVHRMNGRDGDRALFAGVAVDATAFAPPEDMLADMVASIGGATTTAAITTAIDFWFDDPAGGFATMGYTGDTGPAMTRKISESETLTLNARGDDPGIKSLLKGAALAAVTDIMGTAITSTTQAELVRAAGDELFSAGTPLTQMRAEIGVNEERISLARTAQAAKSTSFGIARNEMVSADPFETATLLQDVQRQLEMQFTSTSRLSQLSLVNYL